MMPERTIGYLIGAAVRRSREHLGWPQSYLADRTGLSRAYILRLERGEYASPGMEAVESLAKAMGTTVPLLIAGTESALAQEEQVMLSTFRSLPREYKETALLLLRALAAHLVVLNKFVEEQEAPHNAHTPAG